MIPIAPQSKKPRKSAAEKREEAKVTEAQPNPETGSTDPDASQDAPPTEDQSAPEAPSGPQPSEQQGNPNPPEQDSSESEWPNASNYQPKHRPLTAAGLDQQAAHDAREAERAAQREEHNARTADSGQRGRKVG